MERIVRIDEDDLAWGIRLTAADRLRQANAAFRLYHALHRPFERPFHVGFDTVADLHAWDKERGDAR